MSAFCGAHCGCDNCLNVAQHTEEVADARQKVMQKRELDQARTQIVQGESRRRRVSATELANAAAPTPVAAQTAPSPSASLNFVCGS